MAEVTLKRLLRQDTTAAMLDGLLKSMGAALRVEDAKGAAVRGGDEPAEADGTSRVRCPVLHEGETIAWVVGPPPQAPAVAAAIAWMAEKEAERKLLGAELLNFYREVNVIHNFAEELSLLLDTASVAQAAIQQASRVIRASSGALLMLDESAGLFKVIASTGPGWDNHPGIPAKSGLIAAIAERGNAEIVNDVHADPRYTSHDRDLASMICAPLRSREATRGILVMGSADVMAYTAGDLKMIGTIAIQTASALENALLYERSLNAAKAEALQATLAEVEEQKQKAEAMLLNILPESVARELQLNGSVQPMYFEDVTVCFTDFVGFSKSTMLMAAEEVVEQLNRYFTAFDRIIERYGLEKLKTIGDSYMFVSGLPNRRAANPIDAVLAAMEIVQTVKDLESEEPGATWKIRVGLHTGPVVAGVVGIHKFAFDVWGETVNLASRMESCGEANRVNVSDRTFARIKDFMALEPRGRVRTKEGQEIEMYFVRGVLDRLMLDCSACPPPAFANRYRLYFREKTPSFPPHLLNRELEPVATVES